MATDNFKHFTKYTQNSSHIPINQKPFYLKWAQLYEQFKLKNIVHQGLDEFLLYLQSNRSLEKWQIRQISDVVLLYENCSKKGKTETGREEIIKNFVRICRLKHYSRKTEQSYTNWIKRFLSYTEKQTQYLRKEDASAFLSYLSEKRHVSASTQNQAFNALLFLFRYILNKDLDDMNGTLRAKRGKHIPEVMSLEEVSNVLSNLNYPYLLIMKLLFGCGLRLMECMTLRIQDIDFSNMSLHVHSGKGDKDRVLKLPENIILDLKTHIKNIQSRFLSENSKSWNVKLPFALNRKFPSASVEWKWQWVFPANATYHDSDDGKIYKHHIHESAVQKEIRKAVKKSGIPKKITAHTFRHTFATILLEKGINIREIQELLGHTKLETTMIYTHVKSGNIKNYKSPLDFI